MLESRTEYDWEITTILLRWAATIRAKPTRYVYCEKNGDVVRLVNWSLNKTAVKKTTMNEDTKLSMYKNLSAQ